MASRQFLKILQSARLGDVSAQQNLAYAYLSGAFKTPIQPANALIWLEKSFYSYKNQIFGTDSLGVNQIHLNEPIPLPILDLLEQIASVPLAKTVRSPSFAFGWDAFWVIADMDNSISYLAQWQLAELLLDPDHRHIQLELETWVPQHDAGANFSSLQKKAQIYLLGLSSADTEFFSAAKALLIKLQPRDQALSSLWKLWTTERNEGALLQAAEQGLTIAKLTHGLRLAQLDTPPPNKSRNTPKSNASLKKAAYWLELAAKDGDRDAWFALGEIYRRPQFSGYSALESDRCFDRAADLGHAEAQLRKGSNLWRKREKIEERVRGLQASYWIWQAHQQGIAEAGQLLTRILIQVSDPRCNHWYEEALRAENALNRHAEYQLETEWTLMCHRLIIANQFNLTKAELLLCEIGELQHEHCVVVDIRHELPKILPKLIQINTTQQRRTLLAAGKIFASSKDDQEGNLRQRRYRFDRVTEWLKQIKVD